MMTDINKFIKDAYKQIEHDLLRKSLFATSAATNIEPEPLNYETIVEALAKIPPVSEPEFDEIRLSKNGYKKLKDELNPTEVSFKEGSFLYCGTVEIVVKDYMPDNVALCVKNSNKDELPKIVAIVDLGHLPMEFDI